VIFPLFGFYFFIIPFLAKSNITTDSLKAELSKASIDSMRIKILFELGNSFIDGPSDSLIYYYQQALEPILKFFAQPQDVLDQADEQTVLTYKKFHFRALNEIGIENFFLGKYVESLDYAFAALKIAEQLEDIGLISECCGSIGIVLKNQGKYPEALEFYKRALVLAIELNDTAWVAACYANAGNVYRRLGNFPKALDYHLKAFEVFEKSGEERRMAIGLMNIGNLYEDQQDFNLALEYYSRALSLSYETEDHKRIAECLINIGNIYLQKGNYPEARSHYEKSLEIHLREGFRHSLDDCYHNIGNSYVKEGNFDKALEYFNKTLAMAQEEDDKSLISEVYGNIAQLQIKMEDFKKGLDFALNSMKTAQSENDLNNLQNAYLLISQAFEGLDNPTGSLKYYKLYSSVKDSLFNSEKYRSIREVEAKYELEKKEQQVALLTEKNQVQLLIISRRNRVVIISGILIILIVVTGYVLIRNNRLKARHQSIELEQKLFRSQMNPHFIFNSLIAIQSYIYKKDPVVAGDFLAKFAELIRITLENSRSEFVILEKEVRMLQHYLDLQCLRFEHKFSYSISLDETIEVQSLKVPPMLAQPFIENAIEHGLRFKQDKGLITIKYKKENSHLIFTVEDNGIGREKAKELQVSEQHQSMATSITRERLEVLSKRHKQKYSLKLTDLMDDEGKPVGTLVVFEMPFKDVI
ncbi:MAG: tetratricopeptide repeat protein, partial [Bacteroidetes bacterium]|nr:tetratricopeptide repeat protein [Bacteroidota bacterium]